MLIAMMSETYEQVQEDHEFRFRLYKVQKIYETRRHPRLPAPTFAYVIATWLVGEFCSIICELLRHCRGIEPGLKQYHRRDEGGKQCCWGLSQCCKQASSMIGWD